MPKTTEIAFEPFLMEELLVECRSTMISSTIILLEGSELSRRYDSLS